jgi:hypothetical protein
VIAENLSFKAWRGWLDALIASVIGNTAGVCYRPQGCLKNYLKFLFLLELKNEYSGNP